MMNNEQLDLTFAALSDSTRRGILDQLSNGQATVGELARPYDMSMAAISKHLKVLEKAGLISRHKEAQWRRCKLEAAPLGNAAVWVQKYRKFWNRQLDQLDDYLHRENENE